MVDISQCNSYMWCKWQIISDVAVERATDTALSTVRQTAEGPGPNFSPAVSVSIWLRETIMHCHQYITYESFFFVKFPFISQMLRDGLRTVAGLVVKSTWIIIPRIRSRNPASALVITFIWSQGHNSGNVSSSAIRAKVHELFRICDKYRWGNETRRNRTDIKMVFVLADKLPGHSEFCDSARPKPASFTSNWSLRRFGDIIWVACRRSWIDGLKCAMRSTFSVTTLSTPCLSWGHLFLYSYWHFIFFFLYHS